jgi:hypothetical protein
MLLRTAAAVLAFAAATAWASAGEIGAIKKFVRFPVDTYNLEGQLAPEIILEQATTPPASEIAVDALWPDKKLLMITFGGKSYHVLYRAVEMNDQKSWDARMAASGGLTCHGKRTGGAPTTIAGTKGFNSPC